MGCPGYDPTQVRGKGGDKHIELAATGTARQWHLAPEHPHLFCGCGMESAACHPGLCCKDSDYGDCENCGKAAPEPEPAPTPEIELSDPLFEVTA